MKNIKIIEGLALGAVMLSLSVGCNEGTKEKPVSREASSGVIPATSSGAAPASSAENPPLHTVTGKIVETMDAAGYTYLKLSTGAGEVWAAVNQAKVKKGDTVTVANAMEMNGFESKTLHRTFDKILFGVLADSGPAAAAAGASPSGPADPRFKQMMAAQHAAAAAGPADTGAIKVPKAEGPNAKTVAEIVDGRAALKDKEIAVRGKVVKFLPGIMGRNWLHVRDGSGSAEKKNNDLTVTTAATTAVGEVVVVKGVVHLDRDFGAGYAYAVLIEDAKITK